MAEGLADWVRQTLRGTELENSRPIVDLLTMTCVLETDEPVAAGRRQVGQVAFPLESSERLAGTPYEEHWEDSLSDPWDPVGAVDRTIIGDMYGRLFVIDTLPLDEIAARIDSYDQMVFGITGEQVTGADPVSESEEAPYFEGAARVVDHSWTRTSFPPPPSPTVAVDDRFDGESRTVRPYYRDWLITMFGSL